VAPFENSEQSPVIWGDLGRLRGRAKSGAGGSPRVSNNGGKLDRGRCGMCTLRRRPDDDPVGMKCC